MVSLAHVLCVAAFVRLSIVAPSADEREVLVQASLHPTASEISRVSGAAEATIRVAYRDLHKFARQLVPAYFADDAAIARLPDPSGGS